MFIEWNIVVTILGGRTGNVMDTPRTIYNTINESDALDEAIEETLTSFNYAGTKVIKVSITKKDLSA